jgi:hypothetical protein
MIGAPLTRPSATLSRRERALRYDNTARDRQLLLRAGEGGERTQKKQASQDRQRLLPAGEGGRRPDEGRALTFLAAITIIAAITLPTLAQSIAATAHGFVVAHDNRVDLYDEAGRSVVWSVNGVAHPTAIITSGDHAAVVDALANEVAILDCANHHAILTSTGETPIDGVFVYGDLYLLERDARAVERFTPNGGRTSIRTAADPAFLTAGNDHVYVYARLGGELEEISIEPFAVRRTVSVPPFASDLESDARNVYLVYPRGAKLATISLTTMTSSLSSVGAVPIDLAFEGSNVAVADPSAKRVWIVEGAQSFSQAFARGFLRGLFGTGSARRNGNRDFPTGVDRVIVRDGRWFAYDSASGTLYAVIKSKSSLIAKDIGPRQFAIAAHGVFIWDDAVRRLQKIAD